MSNLNNIPTVVFIGSKGTGKTSTIKELWGKEDSNIPIVEDIVGRGPIEYYVRELSYMSFSVNSELNTWINNKSNSDALAKADVIVFLINADCISISKRVEFITLLKNTGKIKPSAELIIGLSQIENCIQLSEFANKLFLDFEGCQRILEIQELFYSEFRRNINIEISQIIPYSYVINWQLERLKSKIIDGIIKRHNEIVLNPKLPTIVFIGKTGCGKSSTINNIFGLHLPVDEAVACTKYPIVTSGKLQLQNKSVRLNVVDLPGIAESIEANLQYTDFYNQYIANSDLIICLSQANTRAYTQDEEFYSKLIANGIINTKSKIILGINKIDLIFKTESSPNGIDLSNISDEDPLIADKINDYYNQLFANIFSGLSNVSVENVIVYSNNQNWNISKFVNKIIQQITH